MSRVRSSLECKSYRISIATDAQLLGEYHMLQQGGNNRPLLLRIICTDFDLDPHIIFSEAWHSYASPDGLVVGHPLPKVANHRVESFVVDWNVVRVHAEYLWCRYISTSFLLTALIADLVCEPATPLSRPSVCPSPSTPYRVEFVDVPVPIPSLQHASS